MLHCSQVSHYFGSRSPSHELADVKEKSVDADPESKLQNGNQSDVASNVIAEVEEDPFTDGVDVAARDPYSESGSTNPGTCPGHRNAITLSE